MSIGIICPWCLEKINPIRGVPAKQDGKDVLFHRGCCNTIEAFNELKAEILKLRGASNVAIQTP